MDTSLLEVDVQPTYVRVTVKGKVDYPSLFPSLSISLSLSHLMSLTFKADYPAVNLHSLFCLISSQICRKPAEVTAFTSLHALCTCVWLSIDESEFMTGDTVDHFYSGKCLKPHINKSVCVCVCAGVPAGFACRSETWQRHSTEIPNHRPPAPQPASGTAHYTWNTSQRLMSLNIISIPVFKYILGVYSHSGYDKGQSNRFSKLNKKVMLPDYLKLIIEVKNIIKLCFK